MDKTVIVLGGPMTGKLVAVRSELGVIEFENKSHPLAPQHRAEYAIHEVPIAVPTGADPMPELMMRLMPPARLAAYEAIRQAAEKVLRYNSGYLELRSALKAYDEALR